MAPFSVTVTVTLSVTGDVYKRQPLYNLIVASLRIVYVLYLPLDNCRHLVARAQRRAFARLHGVALIAIRHGVSAVGMRLAVILPGVAVRGDLDFGFVLLDLQRAAHVGDLIVFGHVLVSFINDDGALGHKLILVQADLRPAAVDGNRLHLVACLLYTSQAGGKNVKCR